MAGDKIPSWVMLLIAAGGGTGLGAAGDLVGVRIWKDGQMEQIMEAAQLEKDNDALRAQQAILMSLVGCRGDHYGDPE